MHVGYKRDGREVLVLALPADMCVHRSYEVLLWLEPSVRNTKLCFQRGIQDIFCCRMCILEVKKLVSDLTRLLKVLYGSLHR